jgi:hypothetical protein
MLKWSEPMDPDPVQPESPEPLEDLVFPKVVSNW